MKKTLSFAVLLAFCVYQTTSQVAEPLKLIAEGAKEKCRIEANLSDQEFEDWSSRRKVPTTDNGKCCEVCACWMRELGYMTDGQLNLANMKRLNKLKWKNPAYIVKANEIDEICARTVETAGKKPCEIAIEFKSCKTKMIEEKGGPPPPGSS